MAVRLLKDPSTANCRVFVGHLQTEDMNKMEFEQHFSKYGTVIGSLINRGFGFIQYENEKAAQAAIQSENGQMFKGRRIDVKPAKKDTHGGGGGGGGGGSGGGGDQKNNQFSPRSGGGNQSFNQKNTSFNNSNCDDSFDDNDNNKNSGNSSGHDGFNSNDNNNSNRDDDGSDYQQFNSNQNDSFNNSNNGGAGGNNQGKDNKDQFNSSGNQNKNNNMNRMDDDNSNASSGSQNNRSGGNQNRSGNNNRNQGSNNQRQRGNRGGKNRNKNRSGGGDNSGNFRDRSPLNRGPMNRGPGGPGNDDKNNRDWGDHNMMRNNFNRDNFNDNNRFDDRFKDPMGMGNNLGGGPGLMGGMGGPGLGGLGGPGLGGPGLGGPGHGGPGLGGPGPGGPGNFGRMGGPNEFPMPAAAPAVDKNDCEIIVVHKNLTEYAEAIEARLKKMGLTVDLLFPNEEVPLSRVLGNIANRGCLYAVVIMPINMEHHSLTLNILHGLPQEHRNMPADDALALINRDFSNYKSGGRGVPFNTPFATDRHPDAIQVLLNMLADNHQLTVLQYERVIKYLEVKREEQVQIELGDAKDLAGASLAANDPKQAELQSRILNILNSNKSNAPVPSPVPAPAPVPAPLLPPANMKNWRSCGIQQSKRKRKYNKYNH
ncbi:epsin-like isoform X2 [Microplitis mediator]|uniref:epsin-like isoform X2 n=1 Tax=Microplitis mediator TaxID=375433 RepID=UPI0025530199|nr:epsin-like isoform X2 [Microplitis mediator]